MPLQQTSGAASYDAFGGGAPVAAKYIEDFFQSWLRTGTGSSTTVTTGLNASINKSLVWTKSRSAATNHKLTDTAHGVTKALSSNTTGAEVTDSQGLTAFSSTGYTIGTNTDYNNSGATYVDWQWVATPKFFDVVTYTGTGFTEPNISHNLGSVPGCIIIKRTNSTGDWFVYHRSIGTSGMLVLNSTAASASNNMIGATPTSTTFKPAGDADISGATYVAYLFAHNAGGFGLTGTDNVISCGSFTTDGSGNASVNLGYEPQWIMTKCATNPGLGTNWSMLDTMRGWTANGPSAGNVQANLIPDLSNAESSNNQFQPNATGFTVTGSFASSTIIYIAIRRGPMKVPTSGTSVFVPIARNGANNVTTSITSVGFPTDLSIVRNRDIGGVNFEWDWQDRLRDLPYWLNSSSTNLETYTAQNITTYNMTGVTFGTDTRVNGNSAQTYINYFLRRAPGFFDVVNFVAPEFNTTGTFNHGLGVEPELIFTKNRSISDLWSVYAKPLGAGVGLRLNTSGAAASDTATYRIRATPTTSSFSYFSPYSGMQTPTIAYLFASCPGVSKCLAFTGTGALQTINCGFTSGARFVLIKRTNSTGDWYVWDSSRGLSSSNDPYLLLNSTAAEVTSTNWVDTTSTGFQVTAASGNNVNINGASYIALAIS